MADSNTAKMEERNLFNIWKGLTCIGKALEQYTKRTFHDLHESISKKLEGLSPCENKCGENDDNPRSWCDTCNAWKEELEKVVYRKRDWRKETPWKWKDDPTAVAHVFVPPGWETVDFGDLSTLASLWRNCSKLNTMSDLAGKIDELSKIRNKLAHNSKLAVTDEQKKDYLKVFDKFYSEETLKDVIKIPVKDLRQEVNKKLSADITGDEIKRIEPDLAELKKRIEHMKDGEGILEIIFLILKILLLGIFLLSCAVLSVMWVISQPDIDTINTSPASTSYCLSEQYSVPFTPELQLEGYLTKHRHLVGRDWLIEEIQSELFELNSGQKGILLTADMGYGKTAFISRLVCAKESEAGWQLHKRLLAYHVCRFDATSTKLPALFIRRLVGMIAKKVPEYRKHFLKLPNSSIIFDRHFCGLDPKGCFDQNILFPLQNLNKAPQEKKIIIIDALDECFNSVENSNEISELIRHRAYELPAWIVLLITSRNTSEARCFKDLRLKHLNASDLRNYDDLKTYIKERQGQNASVLKRRPTYSDEVLIDEFVNRSDGNFQFLTQIIDHWLSTNDSGDENDVPSTLDKIYELNFERIFGNDQDQFRNAKLILEVIAASINQVEVAELVEAVKLSNSTVLTDSEFEDTLAKLSGFLKYDKGYVMFTHMSIHDWLLSGKNSKFSIKLKNGHAIITNYLLHRIHRDNSTSRLTQLILYVSRSDNFELEEKFKLVTRNKTKQILQSHLLHRIISIMDSPKAVDLLSKHYKDLDVRDAKGMTASAYAVMNGHLRSLERLMHYGAKITAFVHEHHCRLLLCFGKKQSFRYNLLHLAAQFGQTRVVDFILSKKKALMYSETRSGYLPLHIACEYGQSAVISSFCTNGSMPPDAFCLYLAIKNNHMSVVHVILNTKVLRFSSFSEKYIQDSVSSVRVPNRTAVFYKDLAYLLDTLKYSWYIKGLPLYLSITDGKWSISHLILSDMPIFLNCFTGERGGIHGNISTRAQHFSLRTSVPCKKLAYILKGPSHIAHTIDIGCYLDFQANADVSPASILSSSENLNALGIALVKCSIEPRLYIDINGKLSKSFPPKVNSPGIEFNRLGFYYSPIL